MMSIAPQAATALTCAPAPTFSRLTVSLRPHSRADSGLRRGSYPTPCAQKLRTPAESLKRTLGPAGHHEIPFCPAPEMEFLRPMESYGHLLVAALFLSLSQEYHLGTPGVRYEPNL